jgi:hypothetical protein
MAQNKSFGESPFTDKLQPDIKKRQLLECLVVLCILKTRTKRFIQIGATAVKYLNVSEDMKPKEFESII